MAESVARLDEKGAQETKSTLIIRIHIQYDAVDKTR